MSTSENGCGDTSRKLPFAARHPVLCGLRTIFFGVVVMAVIDLFFLKIGGVKLMERLGIIPVAVGVVFFLKGYFQMFYPARY